MVEFEIELLSAEDVSAPEAMSLEEKVRYVDGKRERGNLFFRAADYAAAEAQ